MAQLFELLLLTLLQWSNLCMAQIHKENAAAPVRLHPIVTIHSMCYSQAMINSQSNKVKEILTVVNRPCSCGGPGWTRVAYLNMSDPSPRCPSNWTLVTTPIRGCGRLSTAASLTCTSVFYTVGGHTYSSVCGRVHAYQKEVTNAVHFMEF